MKIAKLASMSKSWRFPTTLIVAMSLAWGVWGIQRMDDRELSARRAPTATQAVPGVTLLENDEFVSSSTIGDWAASADVVVVANVSAERRLTPAVSETTAVDGPGLVGRSVTLELEEPLWVAPGSRKPSKTININKFGWLETKTEARKFGAPDGSRIEVGGRYLLALVWTGAKCSKDDGNKPARWSTIGSGAALPVTGGVLGIGEFEGIAKTLIQIRLAVPKGSVADLYSGQAVARVGEALRAARVERTTAFQDAYGTASTCPGLEE